MNEDLLTKILESNLGTETKEKIISYWLLPPTGATTTAPIQKSNPGRVGSVKRPSRRDIYLKKNPKVKEEEEAMEKTLDKVVEEK